VNPSVCSALVAAGYSLDASDLNVAAIAIGDLVGSQTVTRSVTNVGHRRSTYTASVSGMTGITAAVSPSSLTLWPGQTKSFTVTFTRTTASSNAYVGGQLSWSDATHTVRSPLVVRPVPLSAPAQVLGTGSSLSYPVGFGYTGAFGASARGLIPATITDGTITDDPANSFSPTGQGVVAIPFTIPDGVTYARFSLFDANVSPASDIDLYLFKGATLVGASGGGTSSEEVNLLNPPAGADYVLYVHGYQVPSAASFRLFSWLLESAAEGNMSVTAPSAATLGVTGTIGVTFNSLAPGTKYLGSVVYSGTAGLPNPTIVRIDTP
jgi:hypothetical protein